MIDLPAITDCVLQVTGHSTLSYIGFSQGTTVQFASLSMLPEMSKKLNLFIAMAPSMKPKGLSNAYVSSAIRSSPELIYLIFGRRSLFPSILLYTAMLPPALLLYFIDLAVGILFAWKSHTMSTRTKEIVYTKIYSLCSVKLMVHWFQIIGKNRF